VARRRRDTIAVQDHKLVGSLQLLGRFVIGPRKPWQRIFPDSPPEFEDSLLGPLRLARERQIAGVCRRPAHARRLLRSELGGLQVGSARLAPIIDVAALLAQAVVPSEIFGVAGVARPSPAGRFEVGDPASGASVEAVGLCTSLARGSPVEVAGRWDAQHQRLVDAAVITSASLSGAGNSQVFSESLPERSASGRLTYDSLGGWQQVLAQKKIRTGARPDESALLPDVADILENAGRRHQLSLGTLCRVHELLTHTPSGIGGKIRDGPAIVRLNGVATFLPPPAAVARHGAEVVLGVLAEHLCDRSDEVPAPVLAADAFARLTDLHPFADGNGRVARAIASWLLVREGYRANPNLTLRDFCHLHRPEHYLTLRHHELDPWSWHTFFFDAVLACFLPVTKRSQKVDVFERIEADAAETPPSSR
jgi:hypothetical protein